MLKSNKTDECTLALHTSLTLAALKKMGICYLQHRITTGIHVGRILSTGCHSRYALNVEHNLSDTLGEVFNDGCRTIYYMITLYLFIMISISSAASNLNFCNDASSSIVLTF